MKTLKIELGKSADADLEGMKSVLNVDSEIEVIAAALGLLKYVIEQKKDGGRLVIENEKQRLRWEIVKF